MTLKPVAPAPEAGVFIRLPDAPPPEDMNNYLYFSRPGYPPSLASHLGNHETTIMISEAYLARVPTRSRQGLLLPDLLIAFDVDPQAVIARNGYIISEQGKPPDFVLEIGSARTGRRDITVKRGGYAAFGVAEYWRFDPSGGRYHRAHLGGDLLVNGEYQPIPVNRIDDEHYHGHSAVLNLDLCWEEGQLRWYDPVSGRYLPTFDDVQAAQVAAEAERDAEREARLSAEARILQLEEELRCRQNLNSPETL